MAEVHGDGWYLTNIEYELLLDDAIFLQNLHAAGVDNWDGYHYGFSNENEMDCD